MYATPSDSVWIIKIVNEASKRDALEYFELLANKIFVSYRIYVAPFSNKEITKEIGDILSIASKTLIRKRVNNEFSPVA